jgi:2'-5' RNA ligase
MQYDLVSIPGYALNEYLVVLAPHRELWDRIQKVKEDFFLKYQSLNARWNKPHITLASFTQREMMEERIVNRLRTVAMGYHPFKVELKDFGSYPTHSIFINVATREPIRNLTRQIKAFQKLLKPDVDHKPYFPDDPIIPIARTLAPWQYEKGWQEYSHRSFTARFIADTLLLLKRRTGEKHYQVLQRMPLQNLPVDIVQGELFS